MKYSNKVLVSNEFYKLERFSLRPNDEVEDIKFDARTRTFIIEEGLADLIVDGNNILMDKEKEYTVSPTQTVSLLAYHNSEVLVASTPDKQVESWTDFSQPKAYDRTQTDNWDIEPWSDVFK